MKKDRMILIILILITLGLASCATAERTPVSETPAEIEEIPAPEAVLRGREWLAEELGVATDQVENVRMEETQWPDACLGLGKPDEMCAQVITPGWLIIFEVDGVQYEVHTDENGSSIRMAGL